MRKREVNGDSKTWVYVGEKAAVHLHGAGTGHLDGDHQGVICVKAPSCSFKPQLTG